MTDMTPLTTAEFEAKDALARAKKAVNDAELDLASVERALSLGDDPDHLRVPHNATRKRLADARAALAQLEARQPQTTSARLHEPPRGTQPVSNRR